jgi:hypothetical protein
MVPTATMLGRFNLGGVTTALLMGVIIPEKAIFLMVRGYIPGFGAVRLITQNSLGPHNGANRLDWAHYGQ